MHNKCACEPFLLDTAAYSEKHVIMYSMVDMPLTDEQVIKLIAYWADLAQYDYDTAQAMFDSGRYPYALYMCHLSTEKILKAIVTKRNKAHPAYIHNLVRLAEDAALALSDDQKKAFSDINEFNIEARYPEDERKFYKRATREYTEKYMNTYKELFVWLTTQLQK
jgi:HEPN domain-containing protein